MSDAKVVGVWAGRATINDPTWNVAAAAAMGVTDLHLMVNDHAGQREPMGFMHKPERGKRTAPVERLLAVGQQCKRHGLRLHLTSWAMPHEVYARGLVEYMAEAQLRLSSVCPVRSVMLDAEEPWTRAEAPQHEAVARLLARGLSDIGRWGVTAIGYAPSSVRWLIRPTHYGVPQCYVTKSSGLKSGGIGAVLDRWRAHLGPGGELWCGLAGYSRTTPALMRESVGASQGLSTCWWSLHGLRASAERAAVLGELLEPQACPVSPPPSGSALA